MNEVWTSFAVALSETKEVVEATLSEFGSLWISSDSFDQLFLVRFSRNLWNRKKLRNQFTILSEAIELISFQNSSFSRIYFSCFKQLQS